VGTGGLKALREYDQHQGMSWQRNSYDPHPSLVYVPSVFPQLNLVLCFFLFLFNPKATYFKYIIFSPMWSCKLSEP
jgi:hypothetical protein